MLDAKSLKLLKWLNVQYKNNIREYYDFVSLYNDFNSYSPADVEDALNNLEASGLIEEIHIDLLSERIKLTYAGRTYIELRRKEIARDIIKSVVTPIIVSAVTTLITLWIKSLLQLPL